MCHSSPPQIKKILIRSLKGICGITVWVIPALLRICPSNVANPVHILRWGTDDPPSSRWLLSHVPSILSLWPFCEDFAWLGWVPWQSKTGLDILQSLPSTMEHQHIRSSFRPGPDPRGSCLVFCFHFYKTFPSVLQFPPKSWWWIWQNNICGLSWCECSSYWTILHQINRSNACFLAVFLDEDKSMRCMDLFNFDTSTTPNGQTWHFNRPPCQTDIWKGTGFNPIWI